MIDVTNISCFQYRAALAAQYTIDESGKILNSGQFQGEPFYTKYFLDWTEIDDNGLEDNKFYLNDDERKAFGLSSLINAVEIRFDLTGHCHLLLIEFPKDESN